MTSTGPITACGRRLPGTGGTEGNTLQGKPVVWPDYEGYREKTDRDIPVFVLEPSP
ncbi:nitroreductase family deazaflavin-dependent oxidoreductase [Actinomadura sp. CNU-125]|uniref:nitroreductase family deazaflavin-dependent oxidoreductase n=1 Tax=Actinomadura sp. CNU-125 TaxID=1904961 RepID=UPI000A6EC21F|nr:nitroreductase family deazaflavin-dependent oxidoreductase [Actinomadura sp. CNU-125]